MCGVVVDVIAQHLRRGDTTSCGCYRGEVTSLRQTDHGESAQGRSPEFKAYVSARSRCNSVSSKSYRYYGGRGIQFRFASFLEFLADVGRKPLDGGYSLDRIDNNGHYESGNVRWATAVEQRNNRRDSRPVEVCQ